MPGKRKKSDGVRSDGIVLNQEGVNALRVAIVHQASYDWSQAIKRKAKFESKYRSCIECWYRQANPDLECSFTQDRGCSRRTLEYEYKDILGMIDERERFFMSEWCEWLSGMEQGYLLDRLKKEQPNVPYRKH